MRVGVTGATGLIGEALCRNLMEDGHSVLVFARDAAKARRKLPEADAVQWEASAAPAADAVKGLDAIVNLAGEPIAGGRWTPARKRAIVDSRVMGFVPANHLSGKASCVWWPPTRAGKVR